MTPLPSNTPAAAAELLYKPTRTMSAVVCVPLNVMFRLVMFICSPVAVKLNDIIVTLVEPIAVVDATLLVPVIESADNVDVPERCVANVSVIACAEPPPVVTTSAAPSMLALNVLPPVAVLDMLNTTSTIWLEGTLKDRLEKLYLPLTGSDVFVAIGS